MLIGERGASRRCSQLPRRSRSPRLNQRTQRRAARQADHVDRARVELDEGATAEASEHALGHFEMIEAKASRVRIEGNGVHAEERRQVRKAAIGADKRV